MQLIGYVKGKDRDSDKERLRKYRVDEAKCIHIFEEPDSASSDASGGHTLEYAVNAACARFADGLLVVNAEVFGQSEFLFAQKLRAAGKKLVFLEGAPMPVQVEFSAASVPRLEQVVDSQYKTRGVKFRQTYGWRIEGGVMCLDLIEQTVFRWILRMKAEGRTYAQIAFRLNAAGYTGPLGGAWTVMSVFKIMKMLSI